VTQKTKKGKKTAKKKKREEKKKEPDPEIQIKGENHRWKNLPETRETGQSLKKFRRKERGEKIEACARCTQPENLTGTHPQKKKQGGKKSKAENSKQKRIRRQEEGTNLPRGFKHQESKKKTLKSCPKGGAERKGKRHPAGETTADNQT